MAAGANGHWAAAGQERSWAGQGKELGKAGDHSVEGWVMLQGQSSLTGHILCQLPQFSAQAEPGAGLCS